MSPDQAKSRLAAFEVELAKLAEQHGVNHYISCAAIEFDIPDAQSQPRSLDQVPIAVSRTCSGSIRIITTLLLKMEQHVTSSIRQSITPDQPHGENPK